MGVCVFYPHKLMLQILGKLKILHLSKDHRMKQGRSSTPAAVVRGDDSTVQSSYPNRLQS